MTEVRSGGNEVAVPAPRSWIGVACSPAIVRRSLRVAVVVDTLLVGINSSDRARAGDLGPADWAKMLLTYCVPDGVATYAAVQAIRGSR